MKISDDGAAVYEMGAHRLIRGPIYFDHFEDALEAVQAAETLGLGYTSENAWRLEDDGAMTAEYLVSIFDEAPIRRPDEADT